MCDQPADGFGRVHDIGVGQQQIIRRLLRGHRGIDALLQRPQLPGPSRRQAAAAHHVQPRRRHSRHCGQSRRCHRHCRRRPTRPPIDRHNPAEAANRCCHRCSRPRCAPALPPPHAAIPATPTAPNRPARCSAKRLHEPKADRARPREQSKQSLSRALKASAPRSNPASAGRPSRFPKNISTYSMNWARKSLDGRGALARLSTRARSG